MAEQGTSVLVEVWDPHMVKEHVKGMVLCVPPVTGNPLVARTICSILNVKEPQVINGPEDLKVLVGESEETVRNLFRNAIYDDKTHGMRSGLYVIIFDEIDVTSKRRGWDNLSTTADNIVNQLLSMIDGAHDMNNIFVIGTTNRKELIDESLLRHGRLDLHIDLNYPDEEARLKILEIYSEVYKKDKDVDFKEIARRTDGASGTIVSTVPNLAFKNALFEHIKRKGGRMFVEPMEFMSMKLTKVGLKKGLERAMPETSTKRKEPSPTKSIGLVKTEWVLKEYEDMEDKIKGFQKEQVKMKDELSSVSNKLDKALDEIKVELSSIKEHNNKIDKDEIERFQLEEMKLSSVKDHNNKLDKTTMEELGAIVNNLKTEVERLSGLCQRINQRLE